MMERVLRCPQCNAPLTPSRFALQVACSFCGATVRVDPTFVSVERFREAFRSWSSPESAPGVPQVRIGSSHWWVRGLVARGESCDIFVADRARTPSERVLLKLLRSPGDAELLENEWRILEKLHRTVPDAGGLSERLPSPIARDRVCGGPHDGRGAAIYRWAPGFLHTLAAVQRAYPSGVDPRAAVWMWRRLLELLALLHRAQIVHGAVLPQHLLVERGEHGLRLVGFSCAGEVRGPLRAISTAWKAFYPESMINARCLDPLDDLTMSARCIAYALGGDPASGAVPRSVPPVLAALVRETAVAARLDAWELRERVGEAGQAAFRKREFVPIEMPS